MIKVKTRKSKVCPFCGGHFKGGLTNHHVIPRRALAFFHKNQEPVGNVVACCRRCHDQIEHFTRIELDALLLNDAEKQQNKTRQVWNRWNHGVKLSVGYVQNEYEYFNDKHERNVKRIIAPLLKKSVREVTDADVCMVASINLKPKPQILLGDKKIMKLLKDDVDGVHIYIIEAYRRAFIAAVSRFNNNYKDKTLAE